MQWSPMILGTSLTGRMPLKKITSAEAEKIIRSCGRRTSHLWPNYFRTYSAELYCDRNSAYSNLDGRKTWIAENASLIWAFNTDKEVLTANMQFDHLINEHIVVAQRETRARQKQFFFSFNERGKIRSKNFVERHKWSSAVSNEQRNLQRDAQN